jgi:hypothetical protein
MLLLLLLVGAGGGGGGGRVCFGTHTHTHTRAHTHTHAHTHNTHTPSHYIRYASELTHKRVCTGFSIFTAVLKRIQTCLANAASEDGRRVFETPPPINNIMDVDECNQFHRLWSAILYVYSAAVCSVQAPFFSAA